VCVCNLCVLLSEKERQFEGVRFENITDRDAVREVKYIERKIEIERKMEREK